MYTLFTHNKIYCLLHCLELKTIFCLPEMRNITSSIFLLSAAAALINRPVNAYSQFSTEVTGT